MTSLAGRLRRIEAILRPAPHGSDLASAMRQLALERLSDEDLEVFHGIVEYGKQADQWTEREASAMTAYACAFEQAVRKAAMRLFASSNGRSKPGRPEPCADET